VADVSKVKRGFLLALVEWAKKRKTFTVTQAAEEFVGRQIEGKKITAARIATYVGYCERHGIFKLTKNGG
jgi:hypothetical protein